MNEGHLPFSDREDDQQDCVQRYESMLDSNTQYFFDIEEFELIIEHYLEENEPRKAGQVLEFAHLQHPGSAELLFCEVQVLMSMGRLNKALETLDAIEKMEPMNEDVHLHKASIFSQLRNYRRAIDHFKRALSLAEEGHDEIHLDLAFEYENMGAYDEAVFHLKEALEVNPENEAVLHELSYCFDLGGAHEASVTFFRNFTNEYPYSFVAWYNLGNALGRLERHEESIEALDLCLAIDEGFSSAYFSKARALLMLGRYMDAVECYQEVLTIEGPQAVTFSYIGECFEKMERYEQALIHYDQALALDPNWVDAWIGRGVVKDLQGRVRDSVKDLQQAVRLAPDHGDGWYFYANALARDERIAEAIEAFERLNHIEPENLDGWMDHADLLHRVKGPDAAYRKLREAELLHKLSPRFRYRVTSYLLQAGREQEGLLELEEALTIDPSGHQQLMAHFPEAAHMPQVLHLLELYRR